MAGVTEMAVLIAGAGRADCGMFERPHRQVGAGLVLAVAGDAVFQAAFEVVKFRIHARRTDV
jgi:hypothetical protein